MRSYSLLGSAIPLLSLALNRFLRGAECKGAAAQPEKRHNPNRKAKPEKPRMRASLLGLGFLSSPPR